MVEKTETFEGRSLAFGTVPDAAITAVLVAVITPTTLSLRSVGNRTLLSSFVTVLFLDVVLASLAFDTYPFSNLIVLGFAVIGGSVVGKFLSRRAPVFVVLLIAVSALDVLSFVGQGPNAPSVGPQPSRPVSLEYLNFTVLSGSSHFTLGSLDLLLLSLSVMFFVMNGFGVRKTTTFAFVALLFPTLFPFSLLATAASSGIPITPFIAAFAFLFYFIAGPKRVPPPADSRWVSVHQSGL